MKEKSNLWRKILYVFLLYSTLFSPPLAIGGKHLYLGWILWPFCIIYVIQNKREFRRFSHKFADEIYLIFAIIIYSIIRIFLGGQITVAIENLTGIITLIFIPFFFIKYGKKIGIDSVDDLSKYVFIATTVAISSTMSALLIPSVDNYIRNTIIQYREEELGSIFLFRGFGLASAMTSFYPFSIGMIAAIWFVYGNKAGWFKWVLPFAIITCLVNARTGALVAISGMIAIFIFSKNLYATIVTLFLGFIGYIYLDELLALFLSGETLQWVNTFRDEVNNTMAGNTKEGTVGYLLNDMFFTPDSINGWIFGEGTSIFGGVKINGKLYFSDIGFVNQLFFGGIIYCAMLYFLLLKICLRLWKNHQRPFASFLLVAFLIINFKGRFFLATPVFMLSLLLYYAVTILGSTQNKLVYRDMKLK